MTTLGCEHVGDPVRRGRVDRERPADRHQQHVDPADCRGLRAAKERGPRSPQWHTLTPSTSNSEDRIPAALGALLAVVERLDPGNGERADFESARLLDHPGLARQPGDAVVVLVMVADRYRGRFVTDRRRSVICAREAARNVRVGDDPGAVRRGQQERRVAEPLYLHSHSPASPLATGGDELPIPCPCPDRGLTASVTGTTSTRFLSRWSTSY